MTSIVPWAHAPRATGLGISSAKYEIYCIINQLAAEGKSVIMISSELPEILGMSDRIYVLNEGSIVGEFDGQEATQEKIMGAILKSGNKT